MNEFTEKEINFGNSSRAPVDIDLIDIKEINEALKLFRLIKHVIRHDIPIIENKTEYCGILDCIDEDDYNRIMSIEGV